MSVCGHLPSLGLNQPFVPHWPAVRGPASARSSREVFLQVRRLTESLCKTPLNIYFVFYRFPPSSSSSSSWKKKVNCCIGLWHTFRGQRRAGEQDCPVLRVLFSQHLPACGGPCRENGLMPSLGRACKTLFTRFKIHRVLKTWLSLFDVDLCCSRG